MTPIQPATVCDVDAVILAGGLGTRLRTVLPSAQKVIAPVAGQPFLLRLLATFRDAGIRRVVLALGHRADEVMAAIGRALPDELEVVASVETAPLGTAGALRHALAHVTSVSVLVANGDSYIDADLATLAAFHRRCRAAVSMALCRVDDVSRYGSVTVDDEGRVTQFQEKRGDCRCGGLINAGIYLMERSVIAGIPLSPASLERDVLPAYCGKGLFGIPLGSRFIDIGTPEDYARASAFFHSSTDTASAS